jgi:CHAT domain-containing protein
MSFLINSSKDMVMNGGREPWANLVLAGQVAEGLSQFETASSYYNRAAEVFEERRMQLTGDEYKMALSNNASARETYFAASRAFVKWHQSIEAAGTPSPSSILEQAFQASERGKARSLLDLVASRTMIDQVDVLGDASFERYRTETMKLRTARALLGEAYSQEKASQKMRDEIQKEVAELEESVRSLELQRAERGHESGPLHINSKVVTLNELTQQLPKNTLMLQFGYRSFDLVAWAVTQDSMVAVHHTRGHEAVIEHHAHRFRYLCEAGRHDEEGVAQWLTKTLLEPFSKMIQSHQHLIIVPQGSLHLVPFHALPFDGTVLCAHHTISYEPSASVFCHLSSINAKDSKILAIGNPANMQSVDKYTGEKRTPDPLRNAELEAKYIATMSPGGLALTRDKATKDAVFENLPNFDIIHLATHGEADADVPLLSAVYLANGEILTVADLMSKRLQANLVVISACRSCEGELAGGDEIMGFSRALLAAGVQPVVVSLWPVDDQRTTLLMEEFYKSLLTGQPPAAALQTAQNTIRQYSENEIELRLLRIMDAVVKDATEKKKGNVGARNVAGEDKELAPGKASQQAISNPRYWAPFIVIGR